MSLLTLISGCSKENDETGINTVDGQKLKQLVENALWGSIDANARLSGLFNSTTPAPDKYNQLAIDSAVSMSGLKLYSVLVEYPNPVHNVLAVYDDSLNMQLQDNSLNGNIVVKWEILSGKLYLIASENFLSKDILKLSRLSLYSTTDEKVNLVFRTFTRLEKAGKIYQQYIDNTSSIAIVTRLTSNTNPVFNNKMDTFKFNKLSGEYLSSDDTFTKFVLSEINAANWMLEKPELKLENVDKEIIKPDSVSEENQDVVADVKGFEISLNNDWGKPIRISVISHLISQLEGIRYINEKLGAQITIIELPSGSSSSQFVKYKFGSPSAGNYRVRSTDLLKSGKNYIRFFEHSCSSITFILLLQVPKYTYEKNKDFYDEITTSFFVEC